MTDKEIEELGKRAVASKHFRWMPGMMFDGLRVLEVNDEGVHFAPSNRGADFYYFEELEGCFPDLSDPATLGWLLPLVREAYGAGTCVDIDEDHCRVIVTVFSGFWGGHPDGAGYAESMRTFEVECTRETRHEALGAALVAALEAALEVLND